MMVFLCLGAGAGLGVNIFTVLIPPQTAEHVRSVISKATGQKTQVIGTCPLRATPSGSRTPEGPGEAMPSGLRLGPAHCV